MAFPVKQWKDLPSTLTPMQAAALMDLEARLAAYAESLAQGFTLLDQKGDIIAATGPDAAARVPVGTDGRGLVADSSQPAGVAWTGIPKGYTPVNLRDLGAANDGSADVSSLVVSAAANGRAIYIPAGKYLCHADISNIDDLLVFGDGGNTVLHNTTGGDDAIAFLDCEDLTVRDLRGQGTAGTRDAFHLERCPRARVERPMSGGTGRHGIYAEECIGIVVDHGACGPNSGGPFPTGVTPMQSGLVLGWDGVNVDSGCNGFTIINGDYVPGQGGDWAVQIIRAELGTVLSPVTEIAKGGIYANNIKDVIINGYYGELNPADKEYAVGTATVTNGSTNVTGVGTAWNTLDTENHLNAMPGKFISVGSQFARIASVQSDTQLTLAENWPGATQAGVGYEMLGCDLFLDASKDNLISWGRGGGLILFRAASRNVMHGGRTERLILDPTSDYNAIMCRTFHTSASPAIVDAGSGNTIREIDGDTGTPNVHYVTMQEMAADAPAPGANQVRYYALDNGAGKTQLKARFNTGAAVVIATQP